MMILVLYMDFFDMTVTKKLQ